MACFSQALRVEGSASRKAITILSFDKCCARSMHVVSVINSLTRHRSVKAMSVIV
jgi:hypothetical protein